MKQSTDKQDIVCTLSHTTFLIPLRIDSDDRLRNAIIVCYYLARYTDARIIVIENGPESHESHLLLKHHPERHAFSKLTYIFQKTSSPLFHRTRILNDAIDLADTKVVVNYDADVILPLESMAKAEAAILRQGYDCVHPWTEPPGCYYSDYNKELLDDFLVRSLADPGHPDNLLAKYSGAFHTSGSGLAVFFSREAYVRMGAENEAFKAYAPEDFERMLRVMRFGLRYARIPGPVYHLNHPRTPNSDRTNPYMQQNEQLYETLAGMNHDQYQQYYNERNSVTVQVGGGLGNRCFQIAFGMGYAHRTGKTFTLHRKHYDFDNVHSGSNYLHTIFRHFRQLADGDVVINTIVRERQEDYATYISYPSYTRNVLFIGYFQSDRYFADCAEAVRDLFQCPPEVSQQLRDQYQDVDFKNAFFLHNRVQRPGRDGVELHGVPLDDYFNQSLQYVAGEARKQAQSSHGPLTCLVFSNMPEQNAALITRLSGADNDIRFISVEEPDEVRALWLGSLCQMGGICANSSYSWWMSWLIDNPHKIVTMPATFLNNHWPNTGIFYPGVKVIKN